MADHTFSCIDGHTCGNPVRVVIGGAPRLEGATMAEKRLFFIEHLDWIRTALMFEPRGHEQMSGTILYPPSRPEADAAILFIETSGCLPMCGHGTIGTVTAIVEHGLVSPKQPGKLTLEVPAGLVEAHYDTDGSRVRSVRIVNVPSFLHATDLEVDHPDLGRLWVDVAYGGNFYAIVAAQDSYRDMADYSAAQLIGFSPILRNVLNETHDFIHPEDQTIRGLSHILWTGAPVTAGAHARNAVFYGMGAIDRSPCGTGTSARMAQRYARGEQRVGEPFVHESIIGSCFTGRIESLTRVGVYEAIVPSIEGWARVTGTNTIFVNEDDPFAHGFRVL